MTHVVPSLQTPGPRSAAIFAAEEQFLAPGTQSVALFSKISFERGQGAILYDADGQSYIDLLAGVGVASLGYAHPRYVAAMQEQVAKLHVGSFATAHRAELVKLIASITPGDLNRTQFYSSGAEAVEAALRLAKSVTGKQDVIGFWGGFHGKTAGVLPLLGGTFKHGLGPLMPGAYSTPYASCSRCAFAQKWPSCEWHCVDFLRKKIEVETANNIAAIIVEPIQGTAGNIVPPPGYLRALRHVADEIGALLICDEMITGFGRTGKMFAIEHDQVMPDIITVGKGFGGGFPMAGVIAREGIAFAKPWANPSGSSSSYGGNPLASRAALTAIQITRDEGLVDHSRDLGEKIITIMRRWEKEIPIVSDVRGRGLMIGFDLVKPGTRTLLDKKTARTIFDTLLARGVLAMIYNPEVRINPPLVIKEAEALEAVQRMEDVLREPPTDLAHKGTDVEEWADLRFFRPVGAVLAQWCVKLGASADQVTIAGMALGLVAAHLFFYDSPTLNLIGVGLFIISDLLDSADGQVARMTGTSTRLGRMLDGISDNVRFVVLYLHLLARLVVHGSGLPAALALVLAAGISHSLQSAVSDYFRQVYLFLTGGKSELDLPEDAAKFQATGTGSRIQIGIYRDYVARQSKLCPESTALVRAVRTAGAPPDLGPRWTAAVGPVMRQLHWIGTNIRFPMLVIVGISGSVASFCWITILGLNGALFVLRGIHERRAALMRQEIPAPPRLAPQQA